MTDESEPEPFASGTGQPPGSGDGSDARDVDTADGDGADVDTADGDGADVDTADGESVDVDSADSDGDGASGVDTDESSGTAASNPETQPSSTSDDGSFDSVGPAAVDDPSEIDPSELTVARRSLHPRIRIIWVAKAIVTALVAGGLAQLADTFLFGVGPIVPAGVALALLVLGVAHALLRYRVWSYEVREDALYLERGVVTRVRTVVPFVRIQHVDTSRGPIERATGLATSVVYTAGSRGADVTIPGLEADRADDLQHRLKRLAIASEADTAV